jgi:hypothetical protein
MTTLSARADGGRTKSAKGRNRDYAVHRITQSVFCPAACPTCQPAQRVMAPVGKKRVGRNRTLDLGSRGSRAACSMGIESRRRCQPSERAQGNCYLAEAPVRNRGG